MKQQSLGILQAEYRHTKKLTLDHYHKKWETIINEYSLSSFEDVINYVVDHLNDADMLVSHNASVGKLHMAMRKMLTLVSTRNPDFAIRNDAPRDEPIAGLLEAAFPSEIRRCRWAKKHRWRNIWALTTGFGAIKLGRSSIYHYNMAPYRGTLARGAKGAEDYKLLPYGAMTEYTDVSVQEGEANISVIPSTNVFSYPYNAPSIEHVQRWYVRYQRPLVDIFYDDRYNNFARGQVPANSKDDPYDAYFNTLPEECKANSRIGEVVECYDVSSKRWCVFHESVSRELIDWQDLALDISSPLHFFVPIESIRTWRGIPYALRIINQARAVNQLRAILKSKISRDGKTVFLYDPLELTQEQQARMNALKDGEWMPIPGLSDMSKDGKEWMKAVEFGKPSPEMLSLISLFDGDLREMSGLDNPALNVSNRKETTATETSLRSQQTGLDIEDYTSANEEAQEEVAADYLRIILQTWPEKRMVKVTGQNEYSYFWVPVTRDLVLRNFNIEIVAGSTQKLDKVTYTRQWMEMLTRLTELGKMKQADQIAAMQQQPTTGINWEEAIRVTTDLFDPAVARRLLNQRDSATLLNRLMTEYGIIPNYVSDQMRQEIQTRLMQNQGGMKGGQNFGGMPGAGMPGMGTPGMGGGNIVPFQPNQPKPVEELPSGMALQNMPGFTQGRPAANQFQT